MKLLLILFTLSFDGARELKATRDANDAKLNFQFQMTFMSIALVSFSDSLYGTFFFIGFFLLLYRPTVAVPLKKNMPQS